MAALDWPWSLALASTVAVLATWYAFSRLFGTLWLHGERVSPSVRLRLMAYAVLACILVSWAFLGIGTSPLQLFLLAWLLGLGLLSTLLRLRERRATTATPT